MSKTLFKTKGLFLLLSLSVFIFLIFGCSQAGLNLIRQLEARGLKNKAIEKREICFHDFVSDENIEKCYMDEVYSLIADECVNIRKTEPMNQENCENLLYNIVMKPNTLAAGEDVDFSEEHRNTDSLHPGGRGVECSDEPACLEKCHEIFNTSFTKNRCYDYSVSAVDQMYGVFSKLNNPTASNLNSIRSATKLRYLKILLNISTDETLGALDVWGNNQYKIARKWIAENQAVADVFFKIDKSEDNHRKLANYFFNNSTGASTGYFLQFNASLTSSANGDNVLDIMLERRNESGLLWVHDILSEVHDINNTGSPERKNLMLDYCKIDFHSRNERDLFDYVFFKDLLSSILQDERTSPAPDWWTVETVAVDLDSDQWWDSDRVNAEADVDDKSVCEFILPTQIQPDQ